LQTVTWSPWSAGKLPNILAHLLRFCNGQEASEETQLPEAINIEAVSLDNALEGSPRDWFAPVHGDHHLSAIGMTPFLMTALLTG
jgi:hypothetical protein